jgi:hypothetical protein
MDALRRSAKISKLDGITNEYIRGKMDAQGTILDDIIRKQLIWYGHVDRMDPTRLPKIIISWKHEGKKRGRPRRTWRDGIVTAMSERGLRMGEWSNRRHWSMEVGRRRQTFQNRDIYIYIYIYIFCVFHKLHAWMTVSVILSGFIMLRPFHNQQSHVFSDNAPVLYPGDIRFKFGLRYIFVSLPRLISEHERQTVHTRPLQKLACARHEGM